MAVLDSLKAYFDLEGKRSTPTLQLPLLLEYLHYLQLRDLPPLLDPYLQWRQNAKTPQAALAHAAKLLDWKPKQQLDFVASYVTMLHSVPVEEWFKPPYPTFEEFLAIILREQLPPDPGPAPGCLAANAPPGIPPELLTGRYQVIEFKPDVNQTKLINDMLGAPEPLSSHGLGDILFPNTATFDDGKVAKIDVVNAEPHPYLDLAVCDAQGNQLNTSDLEPIETFEAGVHHIDVEGTRYFFKLVPTIQPAPRLPSQAGPKPPEPLPGQLPLFSEPGAAQ